MQALAEVVASLPRRDGQTHELIAVDFPDPQGVALAIQARIDSVPAEILVNNIGGLPEGPAFSATSEEYLRAFTQHLFCNQALIQAVLPGMKVARYGRIINIISELVKKSTALEISRSGGARNPHVFQYTLRFLRSGGRRPSFARDNFFTSSQCR